jgi:putative oxidoreductase
MDVWQLAQFLARLLFCLLFLKSGYAHLVNVKPMAGYAKAVGNVPMPEVMVLVSGVMLLAGGLSLLVGYHPRIGGMLLVLFLVPAAFLMHPYWKQTDPMARAGDAAQFWKNISLAGAALFIAADPHWPWPFSVGNLF